MNRLVLTQLRFAISLCRSNMSVVSNSLFLQSHGISCCTRVSSGASASTASSTSYRAPQVWRQRPQQQSYNWNNSSPRYPAVRSNNAYANGNRVASQDNSRNSLECWTLWQSMNYSVADIVQRQGLTEIQVYEHICECVQQGKEIDWFDLCQEAKFSPQIVFEINDAKEKANQAAQNEPPLHERLDELTLVPVQCGHHVTDIHILLYNTMMTCGITPHEMFLTPLEERPSQVPEESTPAPPKKTISKAAAGAAAKKVIGKLTSSSPAPEEPDSKPKRLTQKHMLQWMNDRNGVTLMELVLEFQGYNECQLMRLILLLERKKLIQLSQGIFRVTAPDDLASSM